LAGHHKLKRNYLPSNRFARPAAMKFGGFLFKLIYMNILEKANEIVKLTVGRRKRVIYIDAVAYKALGSLNNNTIRKFKQLL
jgi:hypothetical protein